MFVLSVAEEYHGEHELRYKDEDYRIIRTYENNEGGIELTCQRSDIE